MSITACIFKISTGIALLSLAQVFTDMLMLNCMKSSRKYEARKFQYSQDLGDYFDQLEALQAQKGLDGGGGVGADSEDDGGSDDEDAQWRRRMEEG